MQKSAVKVDGLQVEFRSLRGELREASSTMNRLDATCAKVSDFSDVMDRISVLSRINDQVVQQGSSIKDFENRLQENEKIIESCTSELNISSSRQEMQNTELIGLRALIDGLTRSVSSIEVTLIPLALPH